MAAFPHGISGRGGNVSRAGTVAGDMDELREQLRRLGCGGTIVEQQEVGVHFYRLRLWRFCPRQAAYIDRDGRRRCAATGKPSPETADWQGPAPITGETSPEKIGYDRCREVNGSGGCGMFHAAESPAEGAPGDATVERPVNDSLWWARMLRRVRR